VAGCGGTPGMLAISATLGSMVAGTYTGHVAVTATGAQGSPAAIIATFIVNAQAANSPFSPQWGSNPQHTGMVGVSGQNLTNKLANIVYDPFVEKGGTGRRARGARADAGDRWDWCLHGGEDWRVQFVQPGGELAGRSELRAEQMELDDLG